MSGEILGPKCLLLVLYLLSTSIDPSWSSCSAPGPIKDGRIEVLPPNKRPSGMDGKYPDASQAKVECSTGYGLIYPEYEIQVCEDGKWKNSINPDGAICGES